MLWFGGWGGLEIFFRWGGFLGGNDLYYGVGFVVLVLLLRFCCSVFAAPFFLAGVCNLICVTDLTR